MNTEDINEQRKQNLINRVKKLPVNERSYGLDITLEDFHFFLKEGGTLQEDNGYIIDNYKLQKLKYKQYVFRILTTLNYKFQDKKHGTH